MMEVLPLMLSLVDRDPGHCCGEAGGCSIGGEKGIGTELMSSFSKHDLASLGVRNHLSSETESGKAAV